MSKRLDLFYYTNDNVVRDSLMINAIACASFNEKLRPQSLGGIDSTAVFLTHKKLNETQRRYGLEENGFEYPIIFRLSFLEENMELIKECLLIESQEDGYECIKGSLAEYDKEKHIGVFIPSFIPFDYLTGVLFQSEDEMRDLYQPSPDLWEPKKLYEILNAEEFNDSIEIEKLKEISNDNFEKKRAVDSLKYYCKKRSILYFSLIGTEEWKAEKYTVNFDPYIVRILDLKAEELNAILQPQGINYETLFSEMPSDFLVDNDGVKKSVYEGIISELFEDDNSTVYDEGKFDKIAQIILGQLPENEESEELKTNYTRALGLLKNNLFSSTGMVFDEVLSNIESFQVLKALSIFMKNPHDIDLFAESIRIYKVAQQDARVAWIFYGIVNGMQDLLGEYKTRILLNRKIDFAVLNTMDESIMYKTETNSIEDLHELFQEEKADVLSDYVLTIKRSVSLEEIYEFFSSEQGKRFLSYDQIKEYCPKLKGFDWKKYTYYEIPESIKPGRINKKELDDIIKKLKTEHIDKDSFYNDLISDKKMFSSFYTAADERLKAYYLKCQRMVANNE